MPSTVSPAGRAAIMQREGCRLIAYRDSKGVPTIGVGHVNATPPVAFMGMIITKEQADAFLAADLGTEERASADFVKVALTQAMVDALASLAFNIGVHGFQGSTVVHKLNACDYRGAADAFLMWEKPAVLKARREGERRQFLSGGLPATPQIALSPNAPVLNGIIGKINQAAADGARAQAGLGPVGRPLSTPTFPSPGPIAPPAPATSLWSRLASLFKRKAP